MGGGYRVILNDSYLPQIEINHYYKRILEAGNSIPPYGKGKLDKKILEFKDHLKIKKQKKAEKISKKKKKKTVEKKDELEKKVMSVEEKKKEEQKIEKKEISVEEKKKEEKKEMDKILTKRG